MNCKSCKSCCNFHTVQFCSAVEAVVVVVVELSSQPYSSLKSSGKKERGCLQGEEAVELLSHKNLMLSDV